MKEILQEIANDNNWYFDYGREDFRNLEIDNNNDFYFKIDPLEEHITFDEFSRIEKRTYQGRCLLVVKSDFDRMYDQQANTPQTQGKYAMYIKRCKDEIKKIPNALQCKDIEIKQWIEQEIINVEDTNFDGVFVKFIIETH